MRLIPCIIFITLIFFCNNVFSQAKNMGSVKGRLVDSTSKQNLKSATISILKKKDSSMVAHALSKDSGNFQIDNIPFGDYVLRISFLGFSDIARPFTISAIDPEFEAGDLLLFQSPTVLSEIIVRTPAMVINGDTTEINASQFKTIPNGTAEDLLKKLPTIEVDKDGTIKAQGETVTRVLVDGKKFFGNDPKLATKNLPAEIIDKIQVIDALSDQSAFSGFDDGERVKTINIITKKDRRKGVFGKASVAAGTEGRKAAAVSANYFNGNRQISFIVQGNNINNQDFSIQDFLGSTNAGNNNNRGGGGGGRASTGANISSGNASGISTTYAGGVNYNDIWGKKTLVNGSYFYNQVNATNNRDRFRETFVANDSSLFNTNTYNSENDNRNHRINFEIDHRFDSANSLLVRTSWSYQDNESASETKSYTTKGKLSPLSDVQSLVNSANNGYNLNNSVLYRHRFKKPGRTFSINLTQSVNTNDRYTNNLSYSNSFNGDVDTLDQISSTVRDGKSWGTNISFTERLGQHSQVELTYNYNHNQNNSDQQTFNKDVANGKYSVIVPNLTNRFENSNISNRGGINYRVELNKDWSASAGMAVQHAELVSDNLTKNSLLSQSFNNIFPAFSIQYRKRGGKNLRFNYRGSTQQPSITQLQDVIDNSNVLNVRSGNPSLKQEFNNNFNLIYNMINRTSFKSWFISLNGSFISNKIANTSTINTTHDSIIVSGYKLAPGAQFTKPLNLNGAFNLGGNINYTLPVKKPKSNIHLIARLNFSRDVNLINDVKLFTKNYSLGAGARYTLNLQEKFDLNFSSNSTYNIVRYSDNKQNTNFFTQRFSIEPTYSTKSGWIFANDFDYIMNRGQSAGYNQSVPLWNASLAKLFLNKKQGELRFTCFDILNQNKNITRTVELNYVEDVRTQVLNRYFLLSFTYYIKKFKGQAPGMRGNNNMRRGNFDQQQRGGGFRGGRN